MGGDKGGSVSGGEKRGGAIDLSLVILCISFSNAYLVFSMRFFIYKFS